MKEKLSKEGLFSDEHKKPIPRFPERVGIITSPTGAAVQDMLNILSRRWPAAELIFHHRSTSLNLRQERYLLRQEAAAERQTLKQFFSYHHLFTFMDNVPNFVKLLCYNLQYPLLLYKNIPQKG